jgi:TolB-like protein/Flp pilus assembly protein TadD
MSNSFSSLPSGSSGSSQPDRLDSWKEIAAYVKREVRTVQRWEKSASLPVHRLKIDKQGTVYAYKAELDAWYRDRGPQLESDSSDKRTLSLFVRVLAAVAAMLIVAYVAFRWFQPSAFLKKKVRLVVIPFTNLSGDPKQNYFSAGLTDEMITRLGSLDPEHLGVIAAASSNALVGRSIAEIGRALDVQYALEGTVRRDANRVRIDVQLIQVSDETHLWATSYDRNLDDILRVQDDVGTAVADKILLALKPSPESVRKAAAATKHSVNPEAYDAYLWGRFNWRYTGDLPKSIESYQLAIQKDGQYALAYAGLASSLVLLGQSPYDDTSPTEVKPKARAAAEHALQLDPLLGEAHAVLGNVAFNYDWDFEAAEREFRRAEALNPNNPTPTLWYSHLCIVRNRLPQALEENSRLLDYEPVSPLFNSGRAEIYYYQRNYDDAIVPARQAIERFPNYGLAYIWLGSAYREKKMYREALDSFAQARKVSGDLPATIALYGHTLALSGDTAGARKALADLKHMAGSRYVSSLYYAAIHVGLGENSKALDALDQAYKDRNERLLYLGVEPMADPLRSEPRFTQLLHKIGIH